MKMQERVPFGMLSRHKMFPTAAHVTWYKGILYLHAKRPIIFSDFNQIWGLWPDIRGSPPFIKFHENPSGGCCGQTGHI